MYSDDESHASPEKISSMNLGFSKKMKKKKNTRKTHGNGQQCV